MNARIPDAIIDRASEWFLEMRETDVAEAERAAFTQWLRSSPAHVQAYLEVASLWGDAAQVSKELVVELDGAATNVVAFDKREFSAALLSSGVEQGNTRKSATRAPGTPFRTRIAVAATILLVIGLGTAGWWQVTRAPTYVADVGEQRVITLADGSIIRLNSRSKVRVDLTPQQRNVELLAGQALFQVAKDHARPFIVQSGAVAVRAVGTQFDVYRRRTGTTVTVVEGRVAVTAAARALSASAKKAAQAPNLERSTDPVGSGSQESAGEPSSARGDALASLHGRREGAKGADISEVFLIAGQQAIVTPTGPVQLRYKANLAAATGWLQQELIFTGEPLSIVIDEFNRYSRKNILLDDPTLAELKINAVFNSTSPQSLLLFLNRLEGVKVNETQTEIHIARSMPHQ